LVLVGAAVAAVGLAAVIWLRRKPHPAEAPPEKKAPWTRSEVLSLAGIVVGAALGAAGLLLSGGGSSGSGGGSSGSKPDNGLPNPVAYAALLREGPFTEDLPDGLKAEGLADVNIADASAAGSLAAQQLQVSSNAPGVMDVFAHFEVYPTPEDALARVRARSALIKRIVGSEKVQESPSSYCSYETIRGPTSWECGGARGLVYAEATVTPNPNSTQYFATDTVSALLNYADEKARVAR
jgi:hypothetical protein